MFPFSKAVLSGIWREAAHFYGLHSTAALEEGPSTWSLTCTGKLPPPASLFELPKNFASWSSTTVFLFSPACQWFALSKAFCEWRALFQDPLSPWGLEEQHSESFLQSNFIALICEVPWTSLRGKWQRTSIIIVIIIITEWKIYWELLGVIFRSFAWEQITSLTTVYLWLY